MSDTTIPEGSLVLVTGANGFIASHVVDTALAAGYRVRGTTRSASKLDSLGSLWEKKYGAGKFEVAVVEDMAKEGAFDEAVKGVSGIAHVASVLSFSSNPDEVVDPTVKGTLSILRSAAKQPTIKRFVLTSSSIAGAWYAPDVEDDFTEDSWNEESVEQAYKLKDDHPAKAFHVYGASKVLGEKAAWKFVQEEKPSFVFNTILPNMNFGPILDPNSSISSAGFLRDAYNGNIELLKQLPPQWFVDVRDTARLHVLALTSPALSSPGARIWAVAVPFNVNDVLRTLRKLYPTKTFPVDVEGQGRNLCRIDNKRGEKLLGGWIGFEESLRANTEGL